MIMKYSSMAVFIWNDDICQNINIDCMRGYIENCHPEKTNVDRGEALVYLRFQGDISQSIIMILYWMLIKYIGYITFGFNLIQVGLIFEFVFRSRYFLEYHPSLSNITRCQVPSRVRVSWFSGCYWFLSNISPSESTILYESII